MTHRDQQASEFPGGGRYRTLGPYLRARFGGPVRKVSIDAGFTCPNRDGTVGTGGCIYCNTAGFNPARRDLGVREQIAAGIAAYRRPPDKVIAYFQSFSNTHGPPDRLAALYDEALDCPGVVGLAIGTRPDCLPEPVLKLLARIGRQHPLWLELGLQTASDLTLQAINRGHSVTDFTTAVERCRRADIEVVAHLILGLPGEGPEEMLDSARLLARLGVAGVKLHMLHVVRHTTLEQHYYKGSVALMGPRQYTEQVCDLLELLPPEMVIHRLQANCPPDLLVAPVWMNRKSVILNAVQLTLDARGSRQGKLFSAPAIVPIKQ